MPHVALIGLGIMGSGIAHNLLDADFNLTVYNRSAEKAHPFAAKGASIADTPRDAARDADIVIVMVANDDASRGVWMGEDGILAGARENTIIIESTTVSLAWIRELASLATSHGLRFLDCPVSGSKEAVEAGKLVVYAGGDPAVLDEARPVLETYTQAINHMGGHGTGIKTKLVINHLIGLEMLMLAEGLALAEALEMDRETYMNLVSNGAVGSPFMKRKLEMLRDYSYEEPHFSLKWMRKDLSNVLSAADSVTASTPLAAAAYAIYQLAQAKGLGDHDFAAVYEQLRGE